MREVGRADKGGGDGEPRPQPVRRGWHAASSTSRPRWRCLLAPQQPGTGGLCAAGVAAGTTTPGAVRCTQTISNFSRKYLSRTGVKPVRDKYFLEKSFFIFAPLGPTKQPRIATFPCWRRTPEEQPQSLARQDGPRAELARHSTGPHVGLHGTMRPRTAPHGLTRHHAAPHGAASPHTAPRGTT